MSRELDLRVRIASLELKNPILSASGTFGYGLELAGFCPPEALGAVIAKGVSLQPWPGNESPRVAESASGLLNAVGLENMGVEAFIEKALPPLKAAGATAGANILGRRPEEYARLAARLSGTPVDFLEVNVSCPNVACGGLAFGADPAAVGEVTRAVVENCGGKPVVVKLTPQASDVAAVALAAEKAGASAVSLINTIPAMAVDLEGRRPKLANVVGGLSGPAVKPVALRQVWLCARTLSIPVIGLGGICSARDALEFILVGAAAVQVGTATLMDPRAPLKILEGLRNWMLREGLDDLSQLRGTLRV
ncbi:MAG: dihydroorotate dehydrogenase [Candidatus Adiutrix sp.]|jgi:dihydroorotate dehydrogenase (NAD+) catalytic subunit|nr:dihydroorotate dehydrogenase [Candidatus Adiutrix sp.]